MTDMLNARMADSSKVKKLPMFLGKYISFNNTKWQNSQPVSQFTPFLNILRKKNVNYYNIILSKCR